ncbi:MULTISPECIES: chaplin [Streptomyces]|uniref:Chaplin n=1 Tax=Streptomyces auratus AGR0001 TaxID=1160718 RepID=J1RJ28_9ACTN|nr:MULTISPECIES: chaplin [Streptomyces]MCF3177316.1 chaplin [Streptomyces sioyaensis]QTZ95958.1 chaplin [Streptomyces auratus AGR0001]SOE14588.1 Small secreted domain [Streptomyces sp. 2323.1]
MKNIKRAAAITMAASGLALAGAGVASAQSQAAGGADHSPGIVSGNSVQAPVHVPVNACGLTVTAIGALNPTFGDPCLNH